MSMQLSPGFADPVADAQATFRGVLDAMAHPGRPCDVARVDAPAPLCPAFAAVVLTLVDHETPVWLDPDAAPVQGWIGFHTGAVSCVPAQAAFALALRLPDLATLCAGSDEEPETSATVILQVAGFGSGRRYRLAGPGLRQPTPFHVEGLPADFAAIWLRNHALFPRGVDLILCSGTSVAALPRSTTVRED